MPHASDDLREQIKVNRDRQEREQNTRQFIRGWGDALIYTQLPKGHTIGYEMGYNACRESLKKALNLEWDKILNLIVKG